MKRTFIALLSLLCTAGLLSAQQTPLYLLYNSNCMDQLEYRYIYAGTSVVAYSINPSANEQYILTTGSSGINSPTLPPNTVSCGQYTFNDQFLSDVNNVSRQVYIVHQQTSGYLLVPVIAATQVVRSGTYYLYKAPNYAFAIDTSNLVYESNIATGSSDWYLYFNGLKIRSCFYEYSFKREPTKVSQERSEFDFIPTVGITSERTGMTAVEAENNQYRLVKVNGMALEDYINSKCKGITPPAGNTTSPLSKYTPQVGYGPGATQGGDKETASMTNVQPGSSTDPMGPPPLVNCPEYPGEGYHIVQPKETLNGISRAYNVPVKSLVSWNKIKDPDLILICQKIWLRKPPANATSLAYKGEPASYSAEGPVVRRQDAYWNTAPQTQPATTPPAVYSTTPTVNPATQPSYRPGAQPIVHVVKQGETLYGIGRLYNVSEAEMRRINKYPPSGQVLLQPGMQLFVSDCCPDQQTQPNTTTTQPNYQPNYQPNQPNYQPNYQPGYQPGTQPAGNQPNTGGVLPNLYNTPSGVQPLAPATYGQPSSTAPQTTPVSTQPQDAKKPTYFKEYIVREGDTMNSIAIKYKVSVQELALVNNKEQNETLIAGQRLLIPQN